MGNGVNQMGSNATDETTEVPASVRVAAALRDAIARGRYQAGERVYQDDIAAELSVSRQPVRQAFQRLQAEGLLTEDKPGRLIVSKVSLAEVEENISLRALLEPHAAKLAAGRITPLQIRELRRVNKLIVDDAPNKANWNYEFHKLIAIASGSTILGQFIDRLWCGMPMSPMSQALREDTAAKSHDHHELMIDALERGDGEYVQSLMAEHIAETMRFHLRRKARDQATPIPDDEH